MADEDGRAWLDEHRERGEDLIWIFYALIALSAIAIARRSNGSILAAARCGGGFARGSDLGKRGLYRLRWRKSPSSRISKRTGTTEKIRTRARLRPTF